MDLLAGDCRKRVGGEFEDDVDAFDGSDWMYGGSRSLRTQGNDDALATLADLASPPQKLRPVRCVVKPPSEDRHPLDILAGTLDRLPEMGFLGGDGCFEGTKIADVEESGQLTRGFTKIETQGRVSKHGTSWDGVSLSSSVDSDLSPRKAVTGKRKRKTREKLEHFLEKLVGSMMKRQEKMHNQLIQVMEKMELERIHREEAWRQQEMERMKQNEEARKQEMSRNSSLITFIKSVIGEEMEIPSLSDPPQPLKNLPKQYEWAQTQGDVKFVFPSGRKWPREEVQALIASRSEVEQKGIHKGAIWDEISARLKGRGYERSTKKCKEKWDNMNKYYRRVMESSKKQPEHSKTCSYFQKLGDFYKTNSVSAEKEE